MAKLTAKQRAKLPAKDFGLPEKARSEESRKESGNYPIPDKGHAISAKRLSRQQLKFGNLTRTSSTASIGRRTRSLRRATTRSLQSAQR
jgi:hypothetical protein